MKSRALLLSPLLVLASSCSAEGPPTEVNRGSGAGGASGTGQGIAGSSGSGGAGATGGAGQAGAGGNSAGAGAGGQAASGGTAGAEGGRAGEPVTGISGSAGVPGAGGEGTAGGAGGGAGGSASGAAGAAGAAGMPATAGTAGAGAGGAPAGGATIVNDTFWKDASGTPIYSQGGGMLQVGDTFYWYGVRYRGAPKYVVDQIDNDDTAFEGITTYSSRDLVTWKHEATDKPANTFGWFGRLGVAYHAGTKKYVLVAQGGGGLYFATSDRPNGGFVFERVQTDLPGIVNGATGDQTIFQDDDGQAYLVSSSSMGRSNRYVSPLRASDFLEAEQAVLVYRGGGREGNCMFKYDGRYYHCSSDLHGWNSSQTYCVSASNIRGPYGAEFVMDGTQADYSHVTQTGFFFAVKGTEQTTIVFAGDRWADFAGNGIGFNQWMPLTFTGETPHFHSLSAWTVDVATGRWTVAPGNNWVLNPTFEADRISVTTPVGWAATSGTNSKDSRTGNWSFQLASGGTLKQAIADLPNGSYTLAVWAKSNGSGAAISVTEHGGAERTVAIQAGSTFTQVKLEGIAVTSGRAEVSVTSNGATITVDDFTLVSDG